MYAAVTFSPEEEHPRDVLGFDLFTSPKKRDEYLQKINEGDVPCWPMELPVEMSFMLREPGKLPALDTHTLEARLVTALRQSASDTEDSCLSHAYRCLATCLENFARYGGEATIARVVSMAAHLARNHCSTPYRMAFSNAHDMLQTLIRKYNDTHTEEKAPKTDPGWTPPSRVYYVAVVNTEADGLPPVCILLFEQKHHAVSCLTHWLSQYGIPYEVWRSMRSAFADELLPYARDGLMIDMGEKYIFTEAESHP